MSTRLKLLLLAPNCDGTDVGEAWCAFKWVQTLADHAQITLLTLQRPGRVPVNQQLPGVEVVTWGEPAWLLKHERLNAMLKPAYPLYHRETRRWIRQALAAGRHFDIAHQLTPLALRYPTPLQGLGIPYLLGPQGGSLSSPEGFLSEMGADPWFTRLRGLDALRLKCVPALRASYADAALVLGVAPYVCGLLKGIPLQRFEIMSELGVDAQARSARQIPSPGRLRLLHVGRGVRSKGLRDVVRALAQLRDLPGVTLDCAGRGPEFALCQEEAKRLSVAERVRFHGQISRERVEALYANSDLFVFPSFREPSGSVVFEALRWGLPVIAADRGGPANVVDGSCGRLLAVETPNQLARDLAVAIRGFATAPQTLAPLAEGAQRRIAEIGLWRNKAQDLMALYHDVLTDQLEECAA
jgi:glycosyltransferase involved in cell wall biosynthesis